MGSVGRRPTSGSTRYEADPAHGLGGAIAGAAGARAGDAPTTVRAAVLALRRRHPRWGPKKLRRDVDRAGAASARGRRRARWAIWLRRESLSEPRRRTRYVVPLTQPLAAAQAPNDVWTADFKGWFRTADGTRCDPLTVADACSRFVLCCRIVAPSEAGVRPWFERTFREYGLPRALRTDNGSPFATTGAGRLSHLAVWWLKLGIQLDRIDPGHPEQNGRHERFHLTLQQETTTPPAAHAARSSSGALIGCGASSMTERPHEALGQRPPARVYVPSPRPYPARLEEPWYDATHQVRRVKETGQIRWQGELVFVSEAVRGEIVGLAETERGDWTVRFHARCNLCNPPPDLPDPPAPFTAPLGTAPAVAPPDCPLLRES